VPLRLDAAIRRALAKDPSDRFSSMDDFLGELRSCIAELAAPKEETSEEEAATVIVRAPTGRARRRGRRWVPILSAAALVAGAAIGALLISHNGGSGGPAPSDGSKRLVPLYGAGIYDPPPGDGHEHDDLIPRATDRNTATYWTTEHYRSFQKEGVGLVLVTHGSPAPRRITVKTDTPGFIAEIKTGSNVRGPFERVSDSLTVGRTTTFTLDGRASGRYFVIWITHLADDAAHINEVFAQS
jgi:hypothetical protein